MLQISPLDQARILLLVTIILAVQGCTHIAGNYPRLPGQMTRVTAQLNGGDFQLLAGTRLPLEQAEAELYHLKSQGFSRRDPQIIKNVARRKNIPPALLNDRSGCAYYRFTARLNRGADLTLPPGALEVTLETKQGLLVVNDQGYLLEDRHVPGGCRLPDQDTLAFCRSKVTDPSSENFLVRLPVRGKIVGLALTPERDSFAQSPPSR